MSIYPIPPNLMIYYKLDGTFQLTTPKIGLWSGLRSSMRTKLTNSERHLIELVQYFHSIVRLLLK